MCARITNETRAKLAMELLTPYQLLKIQKYNQELLTRALEDLDSQTKKEVNET
jgi:hypothetical protein